jgi:Fe2+ transport system protein FeoA
MLIIPLSEFREGERGVIKQLNGRGTFRKRLQEMGFIRGSEVFVEKYAPLRDPIELVIKGYHVSLRVEEAAQIMMEKLEQEQE